MTNRVFDCGHGPRQKCNGCKNAAAVLRFEISERQEKFPYEQRKAFCADCGYQFHFYSTEPHEVRASATGEDWSRDWNSVKHLQTIPGNVSLCKPCAEWLPSNILRPYKDAVRTASNALHEIEQKIESLEEHEGEGDLYLCESCGEFVETCVVRECSAESCGATFNGDENGRNCPECNRPFSRRLAEQGCPECLEENECEHVEDVDLQLSEARTELLQLEKEVEDAEAELKSAREHLV